MKDEESSHSINLFQQIGNIQGTLVALNANIVDFKNEFRSMTSAQNEKIESLRKDVSEQISDLAGKVETLEKFKASLEGAKSEAKKNAQWSGGITGATAGAIILALIEIIKLFITSHPQ